MLYFISEQTAWYNKQAKAIEATIHTCKMETPEGRYKYWLKKQMAFQKFNAITQLCFMLTGPSEATRAMSELIYLTSQIIDAEKNKSLQGLPKPEVHFFGGVMPPMLPGSARENEARRNNNEWIYNTNPNRAQAMFEMQNEFMQDRIASEKTKAILAEIQEKGTDRRS